MPIWQLCANLLIPNCLRSNLSYSPLAALELYVNEEKSHVVANKIKDIAISLEAHNILLLGFSYKADTPDYRNTKVLDIYNELKGYFTVVDCFDPIVDKKSIKNEFGISIITSEDAYRSNYDLVVKLVDHKAFKKIEFPNTKFIDINEIL